MHTTGSCALTGRPHAQLLLVPLLLSPWFMTAVACPPSSQCNTFPAIPRGLKQKALCVYREVCQPLLAWPLLCSKRTWAAPWSISATPGTGEVGVQPQLTQQLLEEHQAVHRKAEMAHPSCPTLLRLQSKPAWLTLPRGARANDWPQHSLGPDTMDPPQAPVATLILP